MSKFKIINLIDKIFITVTIFLIIYAWINFFIRELWTTFFISLIFTFACIYILFYVLNRKNEKKSNSKKYIQDIDEKFLAFQLLDDYNKLKLLEIIISRNTKTEFKNNVLSYQKNNLIHQVFVETEKEKINQFDLVNIIKKRQKNVDGLTIVCNDFESNLNTKILKNLSIEIISKKDLYDQFFATSNLFPDCSNLDTDKTKKSWKKIMQNFIHEKKTKSYFTCGIILIFSSIILPYRYYYLIFGTTLLLCAILCKLKHYQKH